MIIHKHIIPFFRRKRNNSFRFRLWEGKWHISRNVRKSIWQPTWKLLKSEEEKYISRMLKFKSMRWNSHWNFLDCSNFLSYLKRSCSLVQKKLRKTRAIYVSKHSISLAYHQTINYLFTATETYQPADSHVNHMWISWLIGSYISVRTVDDLWPTPSNINI